MGRLTNILVLFNLCLVLYATEVTEEEIPQVKPPVKVRDMSSAFALFGIAILINYIAIKLLPPLDFIESLPEEE